MARLALCDIELSPILLLLHRSKGYVPGPQVAPTLACSAKWPGGGGWGGNCQQPLLAAPNNSAEAHWLIPLHKDLEARVGV